MRSGVKVTGPGLADLVAKMRELTKREVLVGFPEATAERTEDDLPTTVTNAALAYIHDNGAPEQNIPARPFMYPAMLDCRERVAAKMLQMAKAIAAGRLPDPDKGFHQVGLIVQAAIRGKINEGVPPPLSEYTLRERARRGRKGAKQELANRAAGLPAGTELAKPLVDTGQLRNAVNYVVVDAKRRR